MSEHRSAPRWIIAIGLSRRGRDGDDGDVPTPRVPRAPSSDAIAKYMSSNEGLMIGFALGTLGTLLGGLAAGLKAGSFG